MIRKFKHGGLKRLYVRGDRSKVRSDQAGQANKMAMKNPPHPGLSIMENCLRPLGLNVSQAARVLGVARHTLSRVLHGHAAVSPEMALRLEKAGWSNAEFWLRRQTSYDLAKARRTEDQLKVERYQPRTRTSHI